MAGRQSVSGFHIFLITIIKDVFLSQIENGIYENDTFYVCSWRIHYNNIIYKAHM